MSKETKSEEKTKKVTKKAPKKAAKKKELFYIGNCPKTGEKLFQEI